jgi:hypothetical protein
MLFARLDRRDVVADFGGGAITSDAGALLLGATDKAIGLVERFAACFRDGRSASQVVHDLAPMVGQRMFGIALGYEDLIDHDRLRHDPVMAVLAGKLAARRARCAPLAGKSTLNRLEHAPAGEPTRYHKIGHDAAAIERLFVELFLDAHRSSGGDRSDPRSGRGQQAAKGKPPAQIVLDLDATDDPLPCRLCRHPPGGSGPRPDGRQEGRFFHGYGACPPAAQGPTGGTAGAICRSTSSAAITCWPPSSGGPTSMPRPGRSKRWPASSPASGSAGRG